MLPSQTSHKLQPCDVGVFAPRDEAERLYRVTNSVGKGGVHGEEYH